MLHLLPQEDVKDIQREVQVLKLVGKHNNVAELVSTFEDSAYVHLILELCKGGELFDRVVAKGTFSEKMACRCLSRLLLVPLNVVRRPVHVWLHLLLHCTAKPIRHPVGN